MAAFKSHLFLGLNTVYEKWLVKNPAEHIWLSKKLFMSGVNLNFLRWLRVSSLLLAVKNVSFHLENL